MTKRSEADAEMCPIIPEDEAMRLGKEMQDRANKSKEMQVTGFDEALFGLLLRKLRTDHGYKTAEELSDVLLVVTGTKLTPQSIYRIEKGTRSITYPEFLAYSLLFFGRFDDPEMRKLRDMSAPKAWNEQDDATTWNQALESLQTP